jgi:putative ABC transport system permease protein
VTLAGLTVKNIGHNWLRTVLTVIGVAIAILSFVLIRTTLDAWETGAKHGAQDRLSTINRVTFVMPLPKHYFQQFNGERGKFEGVKAATYANWFGGKHATREGEFFANFAVDTKTYFDVYEDMQVDPAELAAWKEDRQGAIIGEALAKQFDWKVGDDVTLVGTIYPGEWKFHVRGIYTATKKSVDRAQFIFHWDYLNENLPEDRRDKIGWVAATVESAGRAAAVSEAIDRKFDEQDIQTRTMSEQAMNKEFLGGASAILGALDIVSLVILIIMMLILGNTIEMGVRERTQEYGVLLALGFRPKHIAAFVVGEGVTIGLLGGGLGLLIAYPLIEQGLGRWLEENMGAFFPYFSVPTEVALVALGFAAALAGIAAGIPAWRASKLDVIEALRRLA